jgi:hypothetical protein
MQQSHPDSTLPTFLTDPISCANTFVRSLVSGPTLALPRAMLPDADLRLNWLATGVAEKVCNQFNLPQQNNSTPPSTHFWNPLAQYVFVLLHKQLSSHSPPLQLSSFYSEHLPLQNLPPSLWISHSSAAMHPQPPQFITEAPLITIILRHLPHTWSASTILQQWPPCTPTVNESNAQPS